MLSFLSPFLKVTIFFVGIFATGVLGNVIVCVVIVKNASMHTATNYYLFSLAVSDLLFLMMGEYCLEKLIEPTFPIFFDVSVLGEIT